MIIAVGVAVGMVKTRENGVIIEVDRRDIMLVIVLMAKFGVCAVMIALVCVQGVTLIGIVGIKLAAIDSILVSVGM